MPLIERIERALDAGVDPDGFERAAVALLQSRYPWLSPVEAGKDLGRDADIYRVKAGDPDSRGRLLATTGDPLANLKRSHKSWLKNTDFRVDAIVIACSNDITASTRKKADEFCRDRELPLPEYYGRDWLVDALTQNRAWRERLTGVRGRLDALQPGRLDTAERRGPFVGRAEVLDAVRAALAAGQDAVLTGVPGVGKSRLLHELGPELLFAEPLAKDYLAEDLIALAPRCVALDDAHLHRDVLAELVRVRVQEGVTLSIVATTWPEEARVVTAELPGHRHMALELLARDEMDAIVQGAGVTSVRARRLVLDQAEGRPGWAISLCKALVDGDGDRVASGEALLDQVERYLRATADSATTLDAVACVAALDGATQEDLERISWLVGAPVVGIVGAVHTIATSGLLELKFKRWHLQPTLRAPLVSRWFFGPQQHRSWRSIVEAFPEYAHELTTSLLAAADRSPAPQVLDAATRWATTLPPPQLWDEQILNLVQLYAAVDEAAANFACTAARTILSSERPTTTTPWGRVYDPLGSAAQQVLITCVRTWFNEEAVHGLLDLGLHDDRPRPQNPDHPLRVLGEMAHHLDPDRGSIFEVRRLLLTWATDWLGVATESGKRWIVFAEIVSYCFSPAIEGTWTDPASRRTFTIANAVETSDHLHDLIELWGQVATLVTTGRQGDVPDAAVGYLLELFEEWLRLAAGHANGTATVADTQRAAGATGAWAILETLRPCLDSRPGLALRAQQALDLAERWDLHPPDRLRPIVLDEDLVRFVGRREPWDAVEEWIAQRDREQDELAQRLTQLGPQAGTARFLHLTQAAETSSHSGSGEAVALHLARLADDPTDWIAQAASQGSPVLLHHTIREARRRQVPIDRDLVENALHDPLLRGALINAFLNGSELDSTTEFVISQLGPDDWWQTEHLFTKPKPDPILRALLVHPVSDIRAAASLAFAVGVEHGPALPTEWKTIWEAAFLEANTKTVQHRLQWRLQEILKALAIENPRLCADWFERRLLDDDPAWRGRWMHDVEHVARTLPQAERERLARLRSGKPYRIVDLLPHLLGHDADLAVRLLDDGTLDAASALDALSGERDEGVAILAPVLLAHGVPAPRIARRICSQRSWSGKESDAIKADIQWFTALAERSPTVRSVSEIAIDELTRGLEDALEEERQEALRGWE